jgi:hypothetical protein
VVARALQLIDEACSPSTRSALAERVNLGERQLRLLSTASAPRARRARHRRLLFAKHC